MSNNLPQVHRIFCSVLVLIIALLLAPTTARCEPLLLCGWDEVFLIDTSDAQKGPVKKLWCSRAKNLADLPAALRGRFGSTDDCKPVDGGAKVLITSSGGAAALVERATGRAVWYARVPNAHSAELLPRSRVVAASSVTDQDDSGNRLILFDLSRPDQPIWDTPLISAHGVVWDKKRQLLWALGLKELRAYELKDWDTEKPSLAMKKSYPLIDGDGHDLQAVPKSSDLAVAEGPAVRLFDRDKGEFRRHGNLGKSFAVKCVCVHPTTGQTLYIQAVPGQWWSHTVNLLSPAGKIELPDEKLYKARWVVPLLPPQTKSTTRNTERRQLVAAAGRCSLFCAVATPAAVAAAPVPATQPARELLTPLPGATFRFGGPVGQRIDATVKNWLLRAPAANPGMLAMMRLRDRQPAPALVPWAGEFVGKYLVSAIPALKLSDDPELEKTVRAVIAELLACQADDGYLGPFPKSQRLLGNWDLWGHYHVMLALLAWHEHAGDQAALAAARRIGDLVCKTFGPEAPGGRRALSAGSDEMNLAMLHGLACLYRVTGEGRYLAMAREIEKDWEKAGDYFRTGLAGAEFFRTPRPRWESLHDLQGLAQLHLITGDARYRRAFLHHWQSIRCWDRHNNGSFTCGEKTTGNPYSSGAIETCCTVAWMALTQDALRLTGSADVCDELERSLLNAAMAYTHPSGAWCTYDTPMDGQRAASHHSIVFQARPGTADLNCCSVNAPRGLTMLADWALMRRGDGVAVNYLGPMTASWKLSDQTPCRLETATTYPLDGKVRLRVKPAKSTAFTLAIRIPAWAKAARLTVAGQDVHAKPGTYAEIRRTWTDGDQAVLELGMDVRCEAGDLEAYGKVSLFRGPVLLAYDQLQQDKDEPLPPIQPERLGTAKAAFPPADAAKERAGVFGPWLVVDVPAGPAPAAKTLRLCDFASAGSRGNRYASWLSAGPVSPPPPVCDQPADGSAVPAGLLAFTWRRPAAGDSARTHALAIYDSPALDRCVLEVAGLKGRAAILSAQQTAALKPGIDYYWRLTARNDAGQTPSLAPAKSFRIDPALEPLSAQRFEEPKAGPDGILIRADLAGTAQPQFGRLERAEGVKPAEGPGGKPATAVALDGQSGMVVYTIGPFPGRDYTVAFWAACDKNPPRVGQFFCAWAGMMDDPLRICVQDGKLSARIEAQNGYSAPGPAVAEKEWRHLAAVKQGEKLTLYVDGKPAGTAKVPSELNTAATNFALGGNPHYTGASEHLACRLARLVVYNRSMSQQEVEKMSQDKP